MEQSIFKALVDQYQTPHPFLGVDGQAFPMIPYSMKLELIQNAGAPQGMTMEELINAETRRVKQLIDAANERGDTQLATRVLNELYPLMVEDVQSGNPIAVQVYSPVVNQMRYILGVTRQPQAVVQEEEPEPAPILPEDDGAVAASFVEVEPFEADPEPAAPVAVGAEPVAPIAEDVEPVDAGPVQEPKQVMQEEPVGLESEQVAQGQKPVQAESDQAASAQTVLNQDLSGTAEPTQAVPNQVEPKGAPAAPHRKKRTPASSIVLFILAAAFVLAFLLINALPFIGVGTYEELFMMGLFDIAVGCLVVALVCCVIAGIVLWRSKAKR